MSDQIFNKLPLDPEAGLVEQNLKLSCSFRSDQIYKYQRLDICHVLLKSDLEMFNKLAP